MKAYTEIEISKDTRNSLSICSKEALLYHLNDIKRDVGLNKLSLVVMGKLNSLIQDIEQYS